MAGKHVYSKSYSGVSDFIYVDLLPEVKRARQFNVNVIAALFLGVSLSFILIYMPYRVATEKYEGLNSENNDYSHELMLTREEFAGYEINLENIALEQEIINLENHKVDFNNYLDDVELLVTLSDGRIVSTVYSANNSQLEITVVISSQFAYSILNNDFLELSWVESSNYSNPSLAGDAVLYSSTFTLGVDIYAK